MVQISLQNSSGKVVFLRGVPWNPSLDTNGSKSTLVTEVLKAPCGILKEKLPEVCM